MRNLKRALSLALASVMLIGMMVVGASAVNASDFTDADEIVNKDAVSTMSALGIINGKEDGSYFDPTGNVTRAEMAKMLCVAINGGVDPILGVKDVPTFTDIKGTWAESYIEYCAANGIIAGRGNGTFDPTGTVSATEAAKMLLGVLGYDAATSGLVGSDWAINTNVLANQNGLYKGLSDLQANTLLTRDDAAQMIYNALGAKMVELNAAGAYTTSQYSYTGTETVKVGTERGWVVDIVKADGVNEEAMKLDGEMFNSKTDAEDALNTANGGSMPAYSYKVNWETRDVLGENKITKYADETMGHKYLSLITEGDDVLTDVEKDSKGTYSLYMNFSDDAKYTKVEGDYSSLIGQKVEVLYKENDNVYGVYASTESTLIAESTAGKTKVDTDSVKIDGTTYKLDDGMTITEALTNEKVAGVGTNKAAAVKAYDNDDNGKIDMIVVYPFSAAKVTYVGKTSFNTDAESNIKFEDVNTYEDMAKGDYVIKYAEANTVDGTDTYVLAETIEGKVDSVKSDSVRIDGTWYDHDSDKNLDLDNTVKAAVLNGYIVKSEVVTASHDLQDYAIVTKVDDNIDGNQAKLLLADGTTKVVTTKDRYDDLKDDLVTYKVEKGEYVLTAAETKDASKAGFDIILDNGNSYTNTSGKGKIDGESIASDAVIFVKSTKDSENLKYSVLTGAEFAKYSDTGVTVVNAYANKDGNSGYNTVVLAYVTTTDAVTTYTSNYGYVTSAPYTTKNDDGETVTCLSFFDGTTEHEEILTDAVVDLAKGDFITYEENSNGSYAIEKEDGLTQTAIIAYNESNGDIRFTDASMNSNGTNVNAEITKDTVIIGINSDEKTGVEGVEPTLAVETSKDDLYVPNAWYIVNSSGDVVVLFVDTYVNVPDMNEKPVTVTDSAELQDALNTSKEVSFDASKLTVGSTVIVPSGTTLKVTGVGNTYALNITVTSGATLDLSNGTGSTANMLVATVKPGATLINENMTLIGKDGAVTSNSDITVKSAAGNTVDVTAAGTITVRQNLTIGSGDVLDLTDATVVGAKEGVSIIIRNADNFKGQGNTNFYIADKEKGVQAGTYKWTADCERETKGEQSGWMKQDD